MDLSSYPQEETSNISGNTQKPVDKIHMSYDEFTGEMRKRGCSGPVSEKILGGNFEQFNDFKDNDIYLIYLRKASVVLKVTTGTLLSR